MSPPPINDGAPAGPPARKAGLFERVLAIRYLAAVVVVFALLDAVMFLYMGAETAVKTYWHVLTGAAKSDEARPGLELLHSLDFLLVSLVLIILSMGVAKLFLLAPSAQQNASLPSWLQVQTFSELKVLLWETILTALVVIGLSVLSAALFGDLRWTALVLPASIFLLALSLYFMKKA